MPLESIGSYIGLADRFDHHWGLVNEALGGAPATDLKLSGDYTQADFLADRAALEDAIHAASGGEVIRKEEAGEREMKKDALAPRLAQFRAAVRFVLPGSAYEAAMPRIPKSSANQAAYLKSFDEAANLWLAIDADGGVAGFTPPLLLLGGYTQADFAAQIAALRAAFVAVDQAEEAAKLERKRRDLLLKPMRARMLELRLAVLATLGPDDPLTTSLPRVTPRKGSTPDAVELSAVWNEETTKADLSWTPSTDPRLHHYSLRTAPAPYRADEETVVAHIDKEMTAFSSTVGLAAPGATAEFRVYVVLKTKNEKGSNTVTVTRPEG